MKYLFIVWMFPAFTVYAQQTEKEMKTDVTDVTVFLNSAQVTRTGAVQVPEGKCSILIKNLTPYADEKSIQVSAKGNFIILSVSYHLDYLRQPEQTSKIKELIRQIAEVDDSLSYLKARSEVNMETIDMLNKNKKIGNETAGTDINQLKTAVKYFEQEMANIKISEIRIAKKIKDFTELRTKLNNQLSELNNRQNQPTGEIKVETQSDKSSEASFVITYQTGNAGWKPVYDLKAISVSDPVDLQYNAAVSQNSGEDWNNVNIGLSNANPNQTGSAPVIQPWYIDFMQVQPVQRLLKSKAAGVAVQAMPAARDDRMDLAEEANAGSIPVNLEEYQTSFSFRVSKPYSIKSGGEELKIALMKYSIPASFRYFTVPKLDQDAFLIADITGWDQYNLLQGEANIYFENTYVGRTIIDPMIQSDTMKISLGRDKSVVISRKKIETFTQKKFIGSNKIETRGFDISIRNNKSKPVNITVKDQIPVSTRSEITVNALETGGAEYDKGRGELTWDLQLGPQEQKDLKFQYEVRYPKNQRIILE